MNWICPICQKENDKSWICECGFDESKNYEKYPVLMKTDLVIQHVINKENASSFFIKGVQNGSVQEVEKVLKLYPEIYGAVIEEDYTLLGYALHHERADIAKVLIKFGVNCNEFGFQSKQISLSVLAMAINLGDIDLVKLLIKNGADCNGIAQKEGLTRFSTLGYAIRLKNIEVVEILLCNGAKCDVIAQKEGLTQFSALGYAIGLKNIEIVKLLIAYGVDLNFSIAYQYKDETYSALGYAINYKNKGIVELLLRNGAKCNGTAQKEGFTQLSALGCAIKLNNIEIVKMLLCNGADCNGTAQKEGFTQFSALGYAIRLKNIEIIKLLIYYGVHLNFLIACQYKGETYSALGYAINCKNEEIIRLLLEKGASSVIWNYSVRENKYTALGCAIVLGNVEAIKLLLEHGVDPNNPTCINGVFSPYIEFEGVDYFVGPQPRSPLAYAIELKRMEIIKLLLEYGASWDSVGVGFINRIRLKKRVEKKLDI